jgi:hypothetical protein
VKPRAPKAKAQPAQPAIASQPFDAELQQPLPSANLTPEQARQATLGPWEFHSEKWELAYIRRVEATIAALKSAGVPVLWVGLPSQRSTKVSADQSYLNEIYRSRAEKAGITYVDIWDGFVDEAGRFSPQGPDYEGQIRRLRTGDGVYFTKFGARKLAHYVEREIQRGLTNRALPVALPAEPAPVTPRLGGTSSRPLAGPVMPLTVSTTGGDELLGATRTARPTTPDPVATRVLTRGEPLPAPNGRGDDFAWPRGSAPMVVNVEPPPTPPQAPSAAARGQQPTAGQPKGQGATAQADEQPKPQQPAQKKSATRPQASRPAWNPFGNFR